MTRPQRPVAELPVGELPVGELPVGDLPVEDLTHQPVGALPIAALAIAGRPPVARPIASPPLAAPRLAEDPLPLVIEPPIPEPRGPVSEQLIDHLRRNVHDLGPWATLADDPLTGEDGPLALHLLYELHYRGLADVDERWEWHPDLLALRAELEARFEDRLVEELGPPPLALGRDDVVAELDRLSAPVPGAPSLSGWMAEHGNLTHLREFVVHRSIYQLKEADPHTFGIPRLVGQAKAAMVEIQKGEYGDGDPHGVHATMFATTMTELGLDPAYGAYVDAVPGVTLTTGNLISYLGLHRRWRGALVGHLALFEMCSVGPMGRYADTFRRLGVSDEAARFYDIHVEADAHHEVVGRNDLAGGFVDAEPLLAGEVVFGAKALGLVESTFARHLRERWDADESSLRHPLHP